MFPAWLRDGMTSKMTAIVCTSPNLSGMPHNAISNASDAERGGLVLSRHSCAARSRPTVKANAGALTYGMAAYPAPRLA